MKKIVIHVENDKIKGYTDFLYFRGEKETALIVDVEDDFNFNYYKLVNSELVELSEAEKTAVDLTPEVSEKHNLITAERDKRILTGFAYNGFQIQSDPGSQAIAHQYLTKQIAGMIVFPITWRTMDNQYMQIVDSAEFTAFTDAMTLHINTHFSESWAAKDQIDNASSVAEVETIYNNYMGV